MTSTFPDSAYDDGDSFCLLADTRRLFGEADAAKLRRAFGGRTIGVPVKENGSSILAKCIGAEKAAVLVRLFGGMRVAVPLEAARRRREIVRWHSLAGVEVGKIARAADCTERQVYNIRAVLRAAGDLPSTPSKAPAR